MIDYIKRGDAKNAICSNCSKPCSLAEKANSPCVTIIELFRIPSADVAPVRHAHWVPLTDCSNAGIYCSWCHKKVYKDEYSNTMKMHSPYCPNCGAKMEQDNED